eukprot:CAMPEP_0115747182 /NCGR_PEP_ID=MMETSP0272-20121206/93018_1 /TAXON_ID=71861 /ORGANISM="Scrippsiella trochoidea, Strain CCMP3099" /LENGTH=142 /DNA_ID=CAMNT_0003192141 /DNA_START=287 /DNA_END=713 /DNA_ORIENTATION=+
MSLPDANSFLARCSLLKILHTRRVRRFHQRWCCKELAFRPRTCRTKHPSTPRSGCLANVDLATCPGAGAILRHAWQSRTVTRRHAEVEEVAIVCIPSRIVALIGSGGDGDEGDGVGVAGAGVGAGVGADVGADVGAGVGAGV